VSTRSSPGPRAASGAGWAHGRRCRFVQRCAAPAWPAYGLRSRLSLAASCASRIMRLSADRPCRVTDSVVHQVGPSCTACGSSELVKAHTPRRDRPSCRNIEDLPLRPVGAPGTVKMRRYGRPGPGTLEHAAPGSQHNRPNGGSTAVRARRRL
jgi:hypothetical protein